MNLKRSLTVVMIFGFGLFGKIYAKDIQLEIMNGAISEDEIEQFAALEPNDMVSKLKADYDIKVLYVAKTHPQIKPDPKINTENSKEDRAAVQYYSSNGDIKALFEDYSALFIRPYHHFKHNTGEVDRPYFTEPILLLAPFVSKNTMIHVFIHILIFRRSQLDQQSQMIVDNASHSASCGRLHQFLTSYRSKNKAQTDYEELKKVASAPDFQGTAESEASLAEKKNEAAQALLSHYLYNLHYIIQSTGEELATYLILDGFAVTHQWPQIELNSLLTKIQSLTKEFGGLLAPMDRDYQLKTLRKERASYPESIVQLLTGVEVLESSLRKRQAELTEALKQKKPDTEKK